MDLIHFQGLNCYHDCIISIVNSFGLNYPYAFSTLWSETDFRYDPYREAYLTKRMLANLEKMGAKVETFPCLSEERELESLSGFHEGELFIVGIDAFFIPWNPFYQTFHGPHYFIARNAKADSLLCFDPTYGRKDEHILRHDIIGHAFELGRISRVAGIPVEAEVIDEAREISRIHPNTRKTLLSKLHDCVDGEQKSIILLAKYIDTMICNRYLYRRFLENRSLLFYREHLFLNNDYFSEWNAVKNGLYKASVIKGRSIVINDVCGHFNHLIDEEISMAEKMIDRYQTTR